MRKIFTLLFSLIMLMLFSVVVSAEPVLLTPGSSEAPLSSESSTPSESLTPSESTTSSENSSEGTTSSELPSSSESTTSSENVTSNESTTSSETSTSSESTTSSETSSESTTSSETSTSSESSTSNENTTSSENATSSKVPTSSENATSSKVPTSSQNSTSSKVPNSSQNATSSESATSSKVPSSSNTSSVNSSSKPTDKKESKLQIVQLPKKTVYEIGQTLDLTGLKVNIISDSGVIASNNGQNLTIASGAFKTEGEQKIEIKYKNLTAYFYVTVSAKHTHKYGAWTIKTEATCEYDGQKVRECECGEKEKVAVNKLDHSWDAGEIVKKSTTKEEGEIKYTCTRCQKEKSETIPKLSEEVVENKIEVDKKFELTLKWWMIFLPVGLIIVGYITAISAIFKKKA